MPTPSPIIAPIVDPNSGIDITFDRMPTRLSPVPTPSATPIGKPIASTEPKAKIRITMANATPINSDCGGSNAANDELPNSICTPSMSAANVNISAPVSAVAVLLSEVELIDVKAIFRSSLTWERAPIPSYSGSTA